MAETSKEFESIAAALGGLASLGAATKSTNAAPLFGINSALLTLHEFGECVRYLNTRRSVGAIIDIQSEADVQDVLYLLLRPGSLI